MSRLALLFDMDGVLIDAADIHRRALRAGLASVGLPPPPDEEALEARPTSVKLDLLGIRDPAIRGQISRVKQEYTLHEAGLYRGDRVLADRLSELRKRGVWMACVTNSLPVTACKFLHNAGLLDSMDRVFSPSAACRPKPHPDLYLTAAYVSGKSPKECLVFEDSPVGIAAATAAGCLVWPTSVKSLPNHLACLLELL